jgi:FtsP/CotA-like multicopper oxidase with cupredoxin domain
MYDYVEDPENRYPLDPDHHPVQATDPNWIRRNQLQRLRYQPHGSVIECNAGEIIALRIASLGYIRHTLTLDGVPLHVVGADATQLKSKDDGTNNSYDTNSVDVAPGESRDVLFTAPAAGTYLLYDRNFSNLSNSGAGGYGGMITEVRVHASGFPAQSVPPKAGV